MDWNFFATSHGKGENDGVGGDVKNSVWRNVLQQKEVVGDLTSFVLVAKAKFPSIVIEGFTKEKIKEVTVTLKDLYTQHSKAIPETRKYHYIEVIGQLTSLSCPCHNDTSEVVTMAAEKHKINQECKSQSEPADRPIIKPTISQFYYVRYAFLNVKSGNEVQQTLPAICIENDLEEHLFGFLKSINANKSY